ncbi:hypothetical protein QF030_007894 [Streptomyces rishiriensis]|uniref:Uncharacterized protein n=1 Tax=Streptomyces rishiriensis TaxID=68264 RepID=A0ABU0P2V7_STRRH|nr:hypothetical protein [Streptomyces rishiriensis]
MADEARGPRPLGDADHGHGFLEKVSIHTVAGHGRINEAAEGAYRLRR